MACQEDQEEKQTEPQEGALLLTQEQLENVTGTKKWFTCACACFGGRVRVHKSPDASIRVASLPRRGPPSPAESVHSNPSVYATPPGSPRHRPEL